MDRLDDRTGTQSGGLGDLLLLTLYRSPPSCAMRKNQEDEAIHRAQMVMCACAESFADHALGYSQAPKAASRRSASRNHFAVPHAFGLVGSDSGARRTAQCRDWSMPSAQRMSSKDSWLKCATRIMGDGAG